MTPAHLAYAEGFVAARAYYARVDDGLETEEVADARPKPECSYPTPPRGWGWWCSHPAPGDLDRHWAQGWLRGLDVPDFPVPASAGPQRVGRKTELGKGE